MILSGGLGNQLWQLAFAHLLSKFGKTTLIAIGKNSHPLSSEERAFLTIKKVLIHCKHEIEWKHSDFKKISTRARFVPESNYFIRSPRLLDSRNTPVKKLIEAQVDRFSRHFGYYQSIGLLQSNIDEVLEEVSATINQEVLTKVDRQIYSSFLHVRGGDYLEVRHAEELGVLNEAYYKNIFEEFVLEIGESPIVLTNDFPHATKVLPVPLKDIANSPKVEDELQTLALMSQANHCFIANSSFSWWGGQLAKKRIGSLIYAPYPWTKMECNTGVINSDVYSNYMRFIPASFN